MHFLYGYYIVKKIWFQDNGPFRLSYSNIPRRYASEYSFRTEIAFHPEEGTTRSKTSAAPVWLLHPVSSA